MPPWNKNVYMFFSLHFLNISFYDDCRDMHSFWKRGRAIRILILKRFLSFFLPWHVFHRNSFFFQTSGLSGDCITSFSSWQAKHVTSKMTLALLKSTYSARSCVERRFSSIWDASSMPRVRWNITCLEIFDFYEKTSFRNVDRKVSMQHWVLDVAVEMSSKVLTLPEKKIAKRCKTARMKSRV